MDTVQLINLVMGIATFLGTITLGVAGVWAFKRITENHLAHIDKDLKGIKKSVDENKKDINNLNVSVANLNGRLGEKV